MGNLNLPNHFFSDSNTMRAKMKEKQNHRMRRRCTRIPSIQWNMPVLTLLLCIYVTNVFARGTEPTTLLPAPEVLAGNITSSSLTVTFPSLVSAASGDVLAYELQYKAITAHEWTSPAIVLVSDLVPARQAARWAAHSLALVPSRGAAALRSARHWRAATARAREREREMERKSEEMR